MCYSSQTTQRHNITINGEMKAQSVSQATTNPVLKIKGKVTLPQVSISVVNIRTPVNPATNILLQVKL